jgi:hypothetical protein
MEGTADTHAFHKTYAPFHWIVNFPKVMLVQGGFDVIVGNPPFAEVPKTWHRKLLTTTFSTALQKWSRDEDLYVLVFERSLKLLKGTRSLGMVLPLSVSFSTKSSYQRLRSLIAAEPGSWLFAHFDRIPSALFGNDVRTRCTICITRTTKIQTEFRLGTSSLSRWTYAQRDTLFEQTQYAHVKANISKGIPKLHSDGHARVFEALAASRSTLDEALVTPVSYEVLSQSAPTFPENAVFVGGTAYGWFPAWRDIPETRDEDGNPSLPARTAGYTFANEESADLIFAVLCSSLGYWWWVVASDGFNLKRWLIESFPLNPQCLPASTRASLSELGHKLRIELHRHYVFKDNKGRIGNFYLPNCSAIVEKIDDVLADGIPGLSSELLSGIRQYNRNFSRASEKTSLGESSDSEEDL